MQLLSTISFAWAFVAVVCTPFLCSVQASDSPRSQVGASPVSVASSEARVPISASDARKLFREFQVLLKKELRLRESADSREYREFKAKQAQELKRWKNDENEARRKFFASTTSSPERRQYMHGRAQRYNEYLQAQAQARADFLKLQEERLRGIKSQQILRIQEFQEFLTRNEKPPARLWGESAAGG